MRANEFLNEARTLSSGTPLQQLITDFKMFTGFNIAKLSSYAKPGKEQDLKAVVQRAIKSSAEVDSLKTDREKLQFIHDMIKYIQPHMKAHMRDNDYEAFKPRLITLLNLYKAAASQGVTESSDGNQ